MNKNFNNKIYDVIILTDNRYINPLKKDWYTNQVLLEDEILKKALVKKGIKVCKKDWADEKFEWSNTKYAIFRSTWDYFEKFSNFTSWVEETKNKTIFINSNEIIKWNIDKHYLRELREKGINIANTEFIKQGEKITLKKLFSKKKFNEAVIKPAISGAAKETYRISLQNFMKYEKKFQKLIKNKCILFQEFLYNIIKKGEISIIVIDGRFTHAVKKIAKEGDFRVQDDHGGIVKKYTPSKKEIKFAENCIKLCPTLPIYARVDIVYDNNQKLSLSELELIEPELWFRNNQKAAKILANKIYKLVTEYK